MSRIKADPLPSNRLENEPDKVSSNDGMLRRNLPYSRPLRVCVVGAGVSGLRASAYLLRRGVDVTIYEARDRIGGRVAQSDHLGYVVDLGPNWIHGTQNNPIMDCAVKTNTKIHSWEERQVVFDEDGSQVPDEDVREVSEIFWGIISDAFKYSNKHSESIPATRSLMDFIEAEGANKFTDEPTEEASNRKRRLLNREAEMWGAFVGDETRRQSLKYFWLEECLEGENPFVAGTFKKILNEIAKPVLAKAKLNLKHSVISVTTNRQGEEESDSVVAVETANETKQEFDEVILTSPLGWLKRNQHRFHPPLTAQLTKAIGAVGYGSLDKVYITFRSAWWDAAPTAGAEGTIASPPENPTRNTRASTVVPSGGSPPATILASPQSGHYAGFTRWCRPAYAQPSNPNGWDQECLNLAALPDSTAHPTLLYYIYGDCAKHIAGLVTSHATAGPKQTSDALISFFKPYFSLLPCYEPQNVACTPTGALATAWSNDEWAGHGSYTNFQVGLDDGDKQVEIMREGLPERGLWFAGEHTAPFVALGTVTGAWWSGDAVAERICRVYGLQD